MAHFSVTHKLLLAKILAAKRIHISARKREIPRRSASGAAPLSYAQEQLWFTDQLEPGTHAYNIVRAMRLKGRLDVVALERSLNEIVRRHEVLRTTFIEVEGAPVQVIAAQMTLTLATVDLNQLPESEREAEIRRAASEELRRPFDLARGPLLRMSLLRLSAEEHVLLLTMHHIISDGWSRGVVFNELETLYGAFASGRPSPLAELPIQYADYAVWQRERFLAGAYERHLTYWNERLAGAPMLRLPTDRPRPPVQSFRGAACTVPLSETLSAQLKALSQREGVTLFMTLLAAFQTLLARYTQQDDIVVGTDVANRNRLEIEGLIGFFITHVILRADLSGNPDFLTLLKRVRQVAVDAFAHQDVPFSKLVEALKPERSPGYAPLFQVLFVLQNMPGQNLRLAGLTLSELQLDVQTSKFDLAVFVYETGRGIVSNWVYKTDLFDAATVRRMAGHYETLLGSIIEQPDAPLSTLEMLTEPEKKAKAMEREERQSTRIRNLRGATRKRVNLAQVAEIKTGYLEAEETLPLVIEPALADIDAVGWAGNSQALIESHLLEHGAILFRGFDVTSAAEFERFASALCPQLFGEYGDLPREGVAGKVYGSTPYPADQAILFHNESSHMHRWPTKIWFFCIKSAEQGGETPIIDCRKIYRQLDPKLRPRFADKKLMYVRNYVGGLDVDWQTFFHTIEKSVVEDYCRKAGLGFEWTHDGTLKTRQICPAIIAHPQTGEMVFFNQLQLHHISCLDAAVRDSMLSLFGAEDLPRNVLYGDGTPIENSVMDEIGALYREIAVSFPWRENDILMLNNMLVSHGRNPYVGARKIVVAMGEMFKLENLSSEAATAST
ncbi:MAG: TauD/TfdA family dioxygenase [Burkholderiales bacterium]|nr:TauD/TfdA family dioxygenase [Burkholderiales bacterium]